jgi:OFA family oxalate/formate antiporter-like MFS transporter
MPAFAADTFGTRCMGEIYGKVLLAWGVAGIAGPTIMDTVQKATNSYATALVTAACILVLGFILALSYRKPGTAQTPAMLDVAHTGG